MSAHFMRTANLTQIPEIHKSKFKFKTETKNPKKPIMIMTMTLRLWECGDKERGDVGGDVFLRKNKRCEHKNGYEKG